MTPEGNQKDRVVVGGAPVGVAEVVSVARRGAQVALGADPSIARRVERSQAALGAALERGEPVYGVTTGFGADCGTRVPADRARELGRNLIAYHGCGTGEMFSVEEARAAVFCRLVCLARGWSGISWPLLEKLAELINHGITPLIPQEGSVGASGDLTPGSYIAACLEGEREVDYRGERTSAADAFERAGISPHELQPKEALAILNGTSVMTGVASLAIGRAQHILTAAVSGTALCVHALSGNARHFHPAIFEAKPHPGQAEVAATLTELLTQVASPPESTALGDLQDPYSLRCAPHVIGILADGLRWMREWVETEINSANDNPLLHPESGEVLMGGNFYGGHVAFAMDALKVALAHVVDIVDRQVALLVDPRFSRGLPANLVANDQPDRAIHHGFKGCQITASALAAEAQKASLPAAVFSRSTESHNQDKVSLGTIAARDAIRLCQLAERAVAIQIMAATRGCELRGNLSSRPALASLVASVRARTEVLAGDRRLDHAIEAMAVAIGDGFPGAPP